MRRRQGLIPCHHNAKGDVGTNPAHAFRFVNQLYRSVRTKTRLHRYSCDDVGLLELPQIALDAIFTFGNATTSFVDVSPALENQKVRIGTDHFEFRCWVGEASWLEILAEYGAEGL